MVSFGTNGGPIVPPTPKTTTLNPLAPKNPAPVYEDQSDDIPPPVYRAPTPNQYRNLINSYKPNPNLQLGTPLDIKYQDLNTLSQLQVQQQKAELARQQGLGYTGAQVFGVQEYEYDNARNRQNQQNQQNRGQGQLTSAQQFVQQYIPKRQVQQNNQVQSQTPTTTEKPQAQEQKQIVRQQRHPQKDQAVQGATRYTRVYSVSEPQPQQQQPQPQYNYRFHYNYNNNQQNQNQQQQQQQQNQNQLNQQQQQNQQTPGFGVAFSSGLRYYVPQYYYYDSRQQQQQQYQQTYHKSHHGYNEVNSNAIYGH